MGNDELKVERAALKKNAKGFGDGSTTLKGVFDRLQSALDSEGECWGNDNTGKAFSSKYTPARDDALKAFPGLAKKLQGIEGGIQKMAGGYDRAEDASGV